MPSPRLLVIEGNSPESLSEHVAVGGIPAHQGYSNLLRELMPGAAVDTCHPGDPGALLPNGESLEGYDGIAITGSSLHVYNGGTAVNARSTWCARRWRRARPAIRLVLGPAADHDGGRRQRTEKSERPRDRLRPRHPADRSRRQHPMYVGKLDVFNAPTVHLDEVETLPPGATVPRHQCDVGGAERRNPHQRLDRLGGAVSSGISAARTRGDRPAHRYRADRRGLLRRRRRHEELCGGSRYARP